MAIAPEVAATPGASTAHANGGLPPSVPSPSRPPAPPGCLHGLLATPNPRPFGWANFRAADDISELKEWFQQALEDNRREISNDMRELLQEVLAAGSRYTYTATDRAEDVMFTRASESIRRSCMEMEAIGTLTTIDPLTKTRMSRKSTKTSTGGFDESEAQKQMTRNLGEEGKVPRCIAVLDIVICIVILLNLVAMGVQLEWSSHQGQIALGYIQDTGGWSHAEEWFTIVDHAFNATYIMELMIRLVFLRLSYFYDISNRLDVALVAFTSFQLYVLEPLATGVGSKWTFLRVLRFARAVRVLRVVRIMKMFSELRILVSTFFASIRALSWAMVFLFFIMMLSALFLSITLQDVIKDDDRTLEVREWTYKYYGSAARSFYTCFEVTLAGCWPNYFRPLIERVSGWYSIFVMFYISVVVFALTRIISALFLKETLDIASKDAQMQASQMAKQREHHINKLREIFNAADVSEDGELTKQEFALITHNPASTVVLKMLDMETHDANEMFEILDHDGNGRITFEEFLQGVTRLRGVAKSLDMVAMLHSLDRLKIEVHNCLERVDVMVDELESRNSNGRQGTMRFSNKSRFSNDRFTNQPSERSSPRPVETVRVQKAATVGAA